MARLIHDKRKAIQRSIATKVELIVEKDEGALRKLNSLLSTIPSSLRCFPKCVG